MNNNECKLDKEAIKSLVSGFEHMSILTRLEYAKNIIFDKGGAIDSSPCDPALVVATEILGGVIEVLRMNPHAAKLSTAEL